MSKILLWVGAVITLAVALAPPALAKLSMSAAPHAAPTGPVATATIKVEGIDCEACAGPIRKALVAVGGVADFHLDLRRKTVSVSYEPAPGRPDAYVKAIDALGYEATLSEVYEPKKDGP